MSRFTGVSELSLCQKGLLPGSEIASYAILWFAKDFYTVDTPPQLYPEFVCGKTKNGHCPVSKMATCHLCYVRVQIFVVQ